MDSDKFRQKSGKRGQVYEAQTRELIAKVIDFMKNEAVAVSSFNNGPLIPITHYKQRVLAATGISESTYKSVLKEFKDIKLEDPDPFSFLSIEYSDKNVKSEDDKS